MGWADDHIERLKKGETVEFRPRGKSMEPKIADGQLVKVEPVRSQDCTPFLDVNIGDIVLCKVKGNQYLHLVKDIIEQGGELHYKIGNNKGRINGFIPRGQIYGKFCGALP